MTEPKVTKISGEVATSQNGKGVRHETIETRYCAICGAEANINGLTTERFGEAFCSDNHAEEFVKEVRAVRIQAAAPPETKAEQLETSAAGAPKQQGWKRYLKLGACCGAPLLALVFLAGGGGLLLGAVGAAIPYLVALACPVGMYFMMRSMSKMGHQEHRQDTGKGEEK